MAIFDRQRRQQRRENRKRRRAQRIEDRANRRTRRLRGRADELRADREQATILMKRRDGSTVEQDVEILKSASARRNEELDELREELLELRAQLDELETDQAEADELLADGISGLLSPRVLAILEAAVTTLNASEAPRQPWALSLSEILDAMVDLDEMNGSDESTYRLLKAILKIVAYWEPETGVAGLLGGPGKA